MSLNQTRIRRLVAAGAAGVLVTLGACTNSGSDEEGTAQGPAIAGRDGASGGENQVGPAPSASGQTRAEGAGAIGPGSSASTSNVDPVKQSTHTQVDSIPDTRPNAGPGSE
jgi:hypothetical protein